MIAARATRQALKEEERLKAEKRGAITLKWQTWQNGKGSAQVRRVWARPPSVLFPRLGWTHRGPSRREQERGSRVRERS